MDNLDILKKEWQSREQNLPKVSQTDIYKMLLKKSSTIVKWIFVISIAELLFWIGINFLIPKENIELLNNMGVGEIMYYSNFFDFLNRVWDQQDSYHLLKHLLFVESHQY